MSTRERKLKFIDSFGTRTLGNLVKEMLALEGHHFLTDEQLDAMTTKLVDDARFHQHHNMRQRKVMRSAGIIAGINAREPADDWIERCTREANMPRSSKIETSPMLQQAAE